MLILITDTQELSGDTGIQKWDKLKKWWDYTLLSKKNSREGIRRVTSTQENCRRLNSHAVSTDAKNDIKRTEDSRSNNNGSQEQEEENLMIHSIHSKVHSKVHWKEKSVWQSTEDSRMSKHIRQDDRHHRSDDTQKHVMEMLLWSDPEIKLLLQHTITLQDGSLRCRLSWTLPKSLCHHDWYRFDQRWIALSCCDPRILLQDLLHYQACRTRPTQEIIAREYNTETKIARTTLQKRQEPDFRINSLTWEYSMQVSSRQQQSQQLQENRIAFKALLLAPFQFFVKLQRIRTKHGIL